MPKCANPKWTQWLAEKRDAIDKEKSEHKWLAANKAHRAMLNHQVVLHDIDDALTITYIGKKTVEYLKKKGREEREGVAVSSNGAPSASSSRAGPSTSPKKRGRPRKEDESVSNPRPAKRTVSESAIAHSRASASAPRPAHTSTIPASNSLPPPRASASNGVAMPSQRVDFWYITYGESGERRRVHHVRDATLDAWSDDGECFGYVVEILASHRHQCATVIRGIWDFDESRVFGYLPADVAESYPTSTLPLDNVRPSLSARSSRSSLIDVLDSFSEPSVPKRNATSTVAIPRTAATSSLGRQSSKQSLKGKERERLFLSDDDGDEEFGLPGPLLSQQPSPPISRAPSISSQSRNATAQALPRTTLSRSQTMPNSLATSSTSTVARSSAGLTRSATTTSISGSGSGSMGPPPLPSSSQRGGRTQFQAAAPVVQRPGRARISEHVPNLPIDIPDSAAVWNEIGNYMPFKAETKFSVPAAPLRLRADAYDIILVLDIREKDSTKKQKGLYERLASKKIEVTQRALSIGDVAWIAKKKDAYRVDDQPDEVVLDAILERKRMDDLCTSIKDGRFHEQKFRLTHSAITKVFYVVEEYEKAKTLKEGFQDSISTALSSTAVVDNFMVQETRSLQDTINHYAARHAAIQKFYKDQDLLVLPPDLVKRYNYLEYQRFLRKVQPNRSYLTTWDCFQELNSKSGFTTVRTCWAKMLLTINGLSAEKAGLLVEGHATPRSLWQHFRDEEQRERDDLEEEKRNPPKGRSKKSKVVPARHALAHYTTGARRFGDALSGKVYDVLRDDYSRDGTNA
ncbi:Crossover junction endonuclease mus81 [Marasmius tenuissimus]|uniref:Crossover junction endonuclease MUS81 n=1 Tax=Marasmius tenuissimus TaxID=585030 RepID=A0ABR3A898_9AGAR